jgi:hypothetical protein
MRDYYFLALRTLLTPFLALVAVAAFPLALALLIALVSLSGSLSSVRGIKGRSSSSPTAVVHLS